MMFAVLQNGFKLDQMARTFRILQRMFQYEMRAFILLMYLYQNKGYVVYEDSVTEEEKINKLFLCKVC